jgi:hypothetical protein
VSSEHERSNANNIHRQQSLQNNRKITKVNKDFVPQGNMTVSDVFLDAEFKYISRISLSPTILSPSSSDGIYCARTLRCAFTVGAKKNLKISSSRKMV